MIWLVMGILVLASLLLVTQPLYKKHAPQSVPNSEVSDYLEQISIIDAQIKAGEGVAELELAKTKLQRGLLATQARNVKSDSAPPPLLLASLFVIFSFASLGLYSALGRPELTKTGALLKPVLSAPQAMSQNADPQHENKMSLEQLVERLAERLQTDSENLDGWALYARSLMNLGRYDQALQAYANVIKLSNNNPDALKEYEQAKSFIAQRSSRPQMINPGPNQEDIKAASSMSAPDRNAMIQGMVDGLSQKLEDNPNDPNGWARLLRARKVLGQKEQAGVEIDRMRKIFNKNPEKISKILKDSGWSIE